MYQHGLSAKLIKGKSAIEESFKDLNGKGYSLVHIATHGFFLSNPTDVKKNSFIRNITNNQSNAVNSMIRSGLLFAGANRTWTGQRPIDGVDDGILTAAEIATLDLSSVNLVVLSACQTGLGDIVASEGVFGLQRAFKLAGVKTIVMSLWEVDDRATSVMMNAFYAKYINGFSKKEAFKYATDFVRNYRDKDGSRPFESPYYWAGFVMMD